MVRHGVRVKLYGMRELTPAALTGTWATLLLPIDEDDRIGWDALAEQLARLVDAGVDGIYTNGSAGEFWTLSEDEFDRLTALVAEACTGAGLPFQVGAAHPSPQLASSRVRRARQVAPGAIQVVLPDWFPPSLAESVDYLTRIAEAAAPVPLVLYNPPHAKRVLAPAELSAVLDAVPAVVGVKVGDGDASWYDAMRPVADRVSVFVPGHHLATGYGHGAAGAYSNVACLQPRAAVDWWARVVADREAALSTERRIRAFLDTEVLPLQQRHGYCNAALDKLLAVVGDWAPLGTRLRWPYAGVPDDVVPGLRKALRDQLPEFAG